MKPLPGKNSDHVVVENGPKNKDNSPDGGFFEVLPKVAKSDYIYYMPSISKEKLNSIVSSSSSSIASFSSTMKPAFEVLGSDDSHLIKQGLYSRKYHAAIKPSKYPPTLVFFR